MNHPELIRLVYHADEYSLYQRKDMSLMPEEGDAKSAELDNPVDSADDVAEIDKSFCQIETEFAVMHLLAKVDENPDHVFSFPVDPGCFHSLSELLLARRDKDSDDLGDNSVRPCIQSDPLRDLCVPKHADKWIFFKPLKRDIRNAVRLKVHNEVGFQRRDMSVTVHNLVSLHGATREVDVDMMPSNIQATDGKMQNLVLSPSSLTLADLKKIRTWTQSVVGKSAVAYIGPTLTVSVEAAAAVPCILGNAVSTEGRFSIPGDCSDKAIKEEALRALADSGAMQYSDDEGSCRKWCKQKYPSLF